MPIQTATIEGNLRPNGVCPRSDMDQWASRYEVGG